MAQTSEHSQNRRMLFAAGALSLAVARVAATATGTCLTGSSDDAAQINSVRALVAATCACETDGSSGMSRSHYYRCAKSVIDRQAETQLRRACARTVQKFYRESICGRDPTQGAMPCIRMSSTGRASCRIVNTTHRDGTPTGACAPPSRVACRGYTHCIDAGDTNGDLRVGYGDSGACGAEGSSTTTLPGPDRAELAAYLDADRFISEVTPSRVLGPFTTETEPPLVCTVQDVSLATNFDDIVLYSPAFTESVCAGGIVSARSIAGGVPDPIVLRRLPLTASVIGLGLTKNECTVNPPFSCAKVDACRAQILRGGDPFSDAVMSSEAREAYSREQVAIDLKLSFLKHVDAGFELSRLEEVSSTFLKIVQRCYNVNIQPEPRGIDYLAGDVTVDDIESQLPEPSQDDPLITSSVSYGRMILVQFTTSRSTTTDKLRLAIEGRLGKVEFTQELQNIYDQSEKRILILGGDPNAAARFIGTGELDDFLDFLTLARCAEDFPAFPLIYTLNRLSRGVPQFSYGDTTQFQIRRCSVQTGNRKWLVRTFGCDNAHDVRPIDRDGYPICGGSNCPSCPRWGSPVLAGAEDGSLSYPYSRDTQVLAETYLYSSTATTMTVQVGGAVPRVWLNDVPQAPSSQMSLALHAGCNTLQVTDSHQHENATLQLSGIDQAVFMDSYACPSQ